MGKHIITIEATGSHTHPKYGGTIAERAQHGSAEAAGRHAVAALKASGHQIHRATITHWPGQDEEAIEDLFSADEELFGTEG